MSKVIACKKSGVTPTTANLKEDELAVNTKDGKIFVNNGFEIKEINKPPTLDDLNGLNKNSAATNEEIDKQSQNKKFIELPQLWRALSPATLIEKLWLGIAEKVCPVGSSLPWESDVAPEGWAIRKNQQFDKIANPKLAKIWPDGIIPDMRGCGFIGKEDGEIVGSYEEGQVKEHGHEGSTVSSTDLGTKTSNIAGDHIHGYRWARGAVAGSGVYIERSEVQGGYNITSSTPVTPGGEHAHLVGIGSHAHSVMIALFGALKNTINHRKCNWIVRLA